MSHLNTDDLPLLFDDLALSSLSNDQLQLIAAIDACLPQTQCGLCGYADGCLPYAHAIVTAQAAIHLCVPGGDDTVMRLSQLTGRPYEPAAPSKWPINPKTNRPIAMYAVIDESACIGCTKCIPACPVDAIIGSAKHMHSIAAPLCTGCELCLPPCPVDCIQLLPADNPEHKSNASINPPLFDTNHLRQRYHAHLNRITDRLQTDNNAPVISHQQSKIANALRHHDHNEADCMSVDSAQNTIAAARLRSQIKKLTKQLSVRPSIDIQQKIDALTAELAALNRS